MEDAIVNRRRACVQTLQLFLLCWTSVWLDDVSSDSESESWDVDEDRQCRYKAGISWEPGILGRLR